jgi:hypothetical protein
VLLTVYCLVFGGVYSLRSRLALHCKPGPQRVHALSTESRAHSHSTIKCNLSVTITKSSPWRWPSRVETCRSVLQSMIKLSLCILLVISVFEHEKSTLCPSVFSSVLTKYDAERLLIFCRKDNFPTPSGYRTRIPRTPSQWPSLCIDWAVSAPKHTA